MIKAIDLFCGGGGFSIGAKQSGVDVVLAIDFWKPAVDSYNKNVGNHAHIGDLSDINLFKEKYAGISADIVFGGPPCQGFSIINQYQKDKKGLDEKRKLTLAFVEHCLVINPSCIVFENVLNSRKAPERLQAIDRLKENGYHVSEVILTHSNLGGLTMRKRLFTIASKFRIVEITEPPMPEFKGLHGVFGDAKIQYRGGNMCRNYEKNNRFIIDLGKPFPCITTHGMLNNAHKLSGYRKPTPEEFKLLQGFPGDYELPTQKTHAVKIIGNSVCPQVSKYLFENILTHYEIHSNRRALE